MPFVNYVCARCGKDSGEFEFMVDPCKACGCPDKTTNFVIAGFKMPAESSPRYQKWFHSDAVQAKLKSGEYEIMPKSHNIQHY